MKKTLTIVLAIVLSVTMVFAFTGCGDKSSGNGTKVGCIYIGSAGDGGFTQVMDEGLEAAADETGVELIKKENVAENTKDVKDTALNLIDQGCTIIVGCSFSFGDALKELADSGKYDDITFLHFSGTYHNDTNMENFFGSMEEARYLTGMAAAATTKTNKLGYVAAQPYTEVQIGINAFTLGAQAVDPDVEVKVVYINTWGDAEIEKTAAEQLIDAGCDVLTYHADSTATQLAAKEAGIYSTGWNMANNVVGDKYITSAYWDTSAYFIPTFKNILSGDFKPTDGVPFSSYGSIATGLIQIDEFGSDVPKETIEDIEKVKESMKNEEFKVFSGEIKYNTGKTLCKKGQTLTDEEIWGISGEIEGVTATSTK